MDFPSKGLDTLGQISNKIFWYTRRTKFHAFPVSYFMQENLATSEGSCRTLPYQDNSAVHKLLESRRQRGWRLMMRRRAAAVARRAAGAGSSNVISRGGVLFCLIKLPLLCLCLCVPWTRGNCIRGALHRRGPREILQRKQPVLFLPRLLIYRL